jgi:hypothetical protein
MAMEDENEKGERASRGKMEVSKLTMRRRTRWPDCLRGGAPMGPWIGGE